MKLDQEFAVRVLIEGGKIARIDGFSTWQKAPEAAGLREALLWTKSSYE